VPLGVSGPALAGPGWLRPGSPAAPRAHHVGVADRRATRRIRPRLWSSTLGYHGARSALRSTYRVEFQACPTACHDEVDDPGSQ
jgi:hypothetical protein